MRGRRMTVALCVVLAGCGAQGSAGQGSVGRGAAGNAGSAGSSVAIDAQTPSQKTADDAGPAAEAAPSGTTEDVLGEADSDASGETPIAVGATGLPVAGRFGDVQFTVRSAYIDWLDAADVVAGRTPDASDSPAVFVEVAIENLHTFNQTRLDSAIFGLQLVDGTVVRGAKVASEFAGSFDALEGRKGIVAFEPIDAIVDLAGVAVVIGVADSRPLLLPLDGTPVESFEPVTLDITGSGPAEGTAGGCEHPLQIGIEGATLQIDADVLTEKVNALGLGSSRYGRRAALGEVFLVFEMTVHNEGGSIMCGGRADPPATRLVVDAEPRSPLWAPRFQIDAGTSFTGELGFNVPVDAETLTLEVGQRSIFELGLDPTALFATIK